MFEKASFYQKCHSRSRTPLLAFLSPAFFSPNHSNHSFTFTIILQGLKQDSSSSKTSKCEIYVIKTPKHSKRHSCRCSNTDFVG